jgi:hypothetical protein
MFIGIYDFKVDCYAKLPKLIIPANVYLPFISLK